MNRLLVTLGYCAACAGLVLLSPIALAATQGVSTDPRPPSPRASGHPVVVSRGAGRSGAMTISPR